MVPAWYQDPPEARPLAIRPAKRHRSPAILNSPAKRHTIGCGCGAWIVAGLGLFVFFSAFWPSL